MASGWKANRGLETTAFLKAQQGSLETPAQQLSTNNNTWAWLVGLGIALLA